MNLRLVGAFSILLATPLGATAPRAYWVEAVPEDAAEATLREVLAKNAFAGPDATAGALLHISEAHAGSRASGLAQLAAGLLFLEASRPGEALAALRHADVPRAGLMDHALLALGQAQEAGGDPSAAGASFLSAADALPGGPLTCTALERGAEALGRSGKAQGAADGLARVISSCPGQEPRALLRLGEIWEGARILRSAAEAYDRLDRDYPASPEAVEIGARLQALAGFLPPEPPEAKRARALKKATAYFDAGRFAEAVTSFRSLLLVSKPMPEDGLVRTRLGRALLAVGRPREGRAQLEAVPAGSPYEAEAAFHLAKLRTQITRTTVDLESVAARFPGTPWGEEALLSLANHYQKDARDTDAVPYFRRLLQDYPEGRYADRATWRVAWADYRAGRFEDAAPLLERAARLRPTSNYVPGFLYWAGRARCEMGQSERGIQLLQEAVQRYKYTYHGLRAREALSQLPGSPLADTPVLRAPDTDPEPDLSEPTRTRVHALLLIDRFEDALAEVEGLPPTPLTQATASWIEWRVGRLRPAINSMRRAHPEALGAGGDVLPEKVWRILYPLEFRDLLEAKALSESLDPALVAALVCQESTFDPGAVSRAGARGLMQVIPKTGLTLARYLHVPYRRQALTDPKVSLEFGTHYLRLMLDRFGGRTERALAAYNAGPERVDAWTAGRPEMSAEEFVESIPFTETRTYVMTILGAQQQYRRIYSFEPGRQAASSTRAAARP